MSELAVKLTGISKAYRFYDRKRDRALDVLGLARWFIRRKDYYRNFWALRDVDLSLNQGERVGIVGRNGAGKSTMIKIMVGALEPTEGTVELNGQVQALLELGTGFHPEFTGRENIRASLGYQGHSTAVIAAKEEEIVEFAELGEFIDHPFKTYSSGMQARLAFSTAASIEPEILVIDEVLGAGDAYFTGKCMERMRSLTDDTGATVIMVSHDLQSILALSDRVLWIHDGRIVESGDPLRVVKAYQKMVKEYEEGRLRIRDSNLPGKAEADNGLQGDSRGIDTDVTYGQGGARITGVRLLDHQGRDTRILQAGRPMAAVIDFEADEELDNPVFVFCAYLASGETASQWIVSAAECGVDRVDGKGSMRFSVDHLHLGAANYVATVAIYKRLRADGREAEAYHVLDRALHFEVIQPLTMPHGRGLALQPFRARINDAEPCLVLPWDEP